MTSDDRVERDPDQAARLERARLAALAAEQSQDRDAVNEAWRVYRLIRDTGRDPDQLLAEGIELSALAAELSSRQ